MLRNGFSFMMAETAYLITIGLTYEEIGKLYNVTPKAITSRMRNIYEVFLLRSRAELTAHLFDVVLNVVIKKGLSKEAPKGV